MADPAARQSSATVDGSGTWIKPSLSSVIVAPFGSPDNEVICPAELAHLMVKLAAE